LYLQNNQITMGKNSIFFGQPIYEQLINHDEIVAMHRTYINC
jgi:hypothetical protein